MASLNATTYVAEITADTPFGTPVLYFSALIDGSAFISPFVLFTLVENDLIERVFKFSNGRNSQQYVGLTPDPATNTITIVNQVVYSDDPRNTEPPYSLPATFGMSINLVAIDTAGSTGSADRDVRAFVTVNPPPGEPLASACDCIHVSTQYCSYNRNVCIADFKMYMTSWIHLLLMCMQVYIILMNC